MTDQKTSASEIIESLDNQEVLLEFFEGMASGEYYDGTSHQLHFDLDDYSLMIHQEASGNSWIEREDGSLVKIHSVCGYCDTPIAERYTDDCDIMDYGYADFVAMIEQGIDGSLPPRDSSKPRH